MDGDERLTRLAGPPSPKDPTEARLKQRERARRYMVKRRERLREKGFCTQCGKRPSASPHMNTCPICRMKAKTRWRETNEGQAWRPGNRGRPPIDAAELPAMAAAVRLVYCDAACSTEGHDRWCQELFRLAKGGTE